MKTKIVRTKIVIAKIVKTKIANKTLKIVKTEKTAMPREKVKVKNMMMMRPMEKIIVRVRTEKILNF